VKTPEDLAKECVDAWGAEFLRQDIQVSLGERIARAIREAIAQERAAVRMALADEDERVRANFLRTMQSIWER
jgi:hypothetical protein